MNFLKKLNKSENGKNVNHGKLDETDLSKIGNILVITGIITRDDLVEAVQFQESNKNLRIGEILVKLGKITDLELAMAIGKQAEMRKRGAYIPEILHELWRVNINRNKESAHQKQIMIDTVDMRMRKVGC